jgi:hypothetical protein
VRVLFENRAAYPTWKSDAVAQTDASALLAVPMDVAEEVRVALLEGVDVVVQMHHGPGREPDHSFQAGLLASNY